MIIREDNIGIEDIAIRASDTDRFYDATIPFFFSSSQEVAGEHATLFNLGISEMSERDQRTWVIVRTRMDFTRIPKWRERLTFETFPQKGYRLYCPRVVMARDEKGEIVMNAMTHWVLMDIVRKRPLPPKVIEGSFKLTDESKFQNPDIGKIIKYEEADKIEIFAKKSFCPNYFDIDLNKHVNNVVYTRWCCEAIPDDILLNYRIDTIDVQWESQTFEGENVFVETAVSKRDDEKLFLIHRVKKECNDKIVFETNSYWSRKN